MVRQLIVFRTTKSGDAPFEERKQLASFHGAHTRPHYIAIGKHNLHAALCLGVLAVRSVSESLLQRVPDDGAPSERWGTRPGRKPSPLDLLVEVEESDSGLDDGISASSLISMIFFMRCKSRTTLPFTTGHVPPYPDGCQIAAKPRSIEPTYPRFLPRDTAHRGTQCVFAALRTY
jgi:hypothetical protein